MGSLNGVLLVLSVILSFLQLSGCVGEVSVGIQADGEVKVEAHSQEADGFATEENRRAAVLRELQKVKAGREAKGTADRKPPPKKIQKKKINEHARNVEMWMPATVQEVIDISGRWQGNEQEHQLKMDPLEKYIEYGPHGEPCLTAPNGKEYCAPKIFGGCCANSGTTALAAYLNSHTNLTYGILKEHQFFRFTFWPDKSIPDYMADEVPQINRENLEIAFMDHKQDWDLKSLANYSAILTSDNYQDMFRFLTMKQGSIAPLSSYLKQFSLGDQTRDTVQTFDFDPLYLWGYTGGLSLDLMKNTVGENNLKILIAFRDPARQVCVRINMPEVQQRFGSCLSSLKKIVFEPEKYDLLWLFEQKYCPKMTMLNIEHHCYANMVRRWFEILPQEHFLFIKNEELRDVESRLRVLKDIALWLDVDHSLFNEEITTKEYIPKMKPESYVESKVYQECYEILTHESSFLTKCNQDLAEMLRDDKWQWWI